MNMNYGRYFIPNLGMRRIIPFMQTSQVIPHNMGLFNRVFRSLKGINWKGFINGANKTLNAVNQTIPLIKQATPMVDNVKSMVRLAKAFGNETKHKNVSNNMTISNDKSSSLDNNNPIFFA